MASTSPAVNPLNLRTAARETAFIAFGILSASMGLKGFLLSSHFIDGGVTGISMLLAQVFGWPLPILLLVINLPFLALGYRQLGRGFALRSTLAMAGLALCLALVPFPDVTPDPLLTAVFGGLFIGAGIGLAMRGGAVLDGTEVAAEAAVEHQTASGRQRATPVRILIRDFPLRFAGDDVGRIDLMIGTQALYNIGNDVKLHDLAVDDRVTWQILKAETHEAEVVKLAFKLDHFDRTRADVQAGSAFLFTEHCVSCSFLASVQRCRSLARKPLFYSHPNKRVSNSEVLCHQIKICRRGLVRQTAPLT